MHRFRFPIYLTAPNVFVYARRELAHDVDRIADTEAQG